MRTALIAFLSLSVSALLAESETVTISVEELEQMRRTQQLLLQRVAELEARMAKQEKETEESLAVLKERNAKLEQSVAGLLEARKVDALAYEPFISPSSEGDFTLPKDIQKGPSDPNLTEKYHVHIVMGEGRPQFLDASEMQAREQAEAARLVEEREAEEAAALAAIVPEPVPVAIASVRFEGNTVIADQVLRPIAAAYEGKEWTLEELGGLTEAVREAYRERGFSLAMAVIPQQDVIAQQGELVVQVLEGLLGTTHVLQAGRYGEERVRRHFASLEPGKPLELSKLERSILLLNARSGIDASVDLKPGERTGSTDIEVTLEEARRVSASLEANNFGTKTTSEYRLHPSLRFPNLTGRGDELGFNGITAYDFDNMRYGQASYQLPLGYKGLAANAFYGQGDFEVGREFEALNIEGETQTYGFGFSYPWLLESRRQLTVDASYSSRDAEQTVLGTLTSEDKIRKLHLGLNFDRKDGKGRTFLTLGVDRGLGEAFGGMDDDSLLSSRAFALADNEFTKITFDLSRLHRFNARWYMIGRLSGQYGFEPLVSPEQWSIGGPNSVRGHPVSSYLGDSGYTLNLETRYSVQPNNSKYQLSVFFDRGEIFVDTPIVTQEKQTQIMGTGIGARIQPMDNLQLRFDIAVPVGGATDESFYPYFQTIYTY